MEGKTSSLDYAEKKELAGQSKKRSNKIENDFDAKIPLYIFGKTNEW
jgi:hypothetical protein